MEDGGRTDYGGMRRCTFEGFGWTICVKNPNWLQMWPEQAAVHLKQDTSRLYCVCKIKYYVFLPEEEELGQPHCTEMHMVIAAVGSSSAPALAAEVTQKKIIFPPKTRKGHKLDASGG